MYADVLTQELFNEICAAGSKRLAATGPQQAKLQNNFNTMNGALKQVEATGLEAFGGPELPKLVAILRNKAPYKQLDTLGFKIGDYLNALRGQLLRRPQEQVFQANMLNTFQRVTKEAWKECSNRGYRPHSFVPYERFLLAMLIKKALEQSDTRVTSQAG